MNAVSCCQNASKNKQKKLQNIATKRTKRNVLQKNAISFATTMVGEAEVDWTGCNTNFVTKLGALATR